MHITTRHLALTAAGLFAATAAIDIPHDQADPFVTTADFALEALFAFSLAAGAATLASLRARRSAGWAARVGFGLAALGTGVLSFVAAATHVNGHDVLGGLFPLGLLAILLGYLTLAVADLRRRVRPRFAGLVLLAALVGMIALGDGYGLLAWSVGWVGVAALLGPAPGGSATRQEEPDAIAA